VGALAATIGVFLPSLVIIALLVRFYPKLERFQLVKNIMAITLAAVVGLIGGVTVLLGRSIVSTWEEGVLAAVVLVVALKWKVPYWAIILASGLIGALAFR